jgi:uncharacterized membrane protein YvlD (DUF360 family)
MATLQRLIDFYRVQFRLMWTWRTGRRAFVRRVLVSLATSFVAFGAMVWVVPGITVRDWLAIAQAVIVITLVNAFVRPLIIALVSARSLALTGLLVLLYQVAVIMFAAGIIPGLDVGGVIPAFVGSWVFAIVNSILTSVFALDSEEGYYGALIRQLRARREDVIRTDSPGVVIVQIDGLAHPILMHQVRAGRVPVMSRWARRHSHRFTAWEALLPSQTSASQAGILHGNNDGIPAFRWYEKAAGDAAGRMYVSSSPADALEIVQRISNGEGLLSNDGASIGNLVTGDARRSYLTMATLREPGQGIGRSAAFYSFFVSPYAYAHLIVQFVGEIIKERIQVRRMRRTGIEPRLDRDYRYALARAATNVAMRSVNTSLILEEMYRGSPVIYCDFTDYDEIAHHSGPERPDSLDALDGVDRVLGHLEKATAHTPRPYRFVVVSDHGQSFGATFKQRFGVSLAEVVEGLMVGRPVVASGDTGTVGSPQLYAFLSEFSQARGAGPAIARAALSGRSGAAVDPAASITVSHGDRPRRNVGAGYISADLVVCASGNLAHVYFPSMPGRLTAESIEAAHPGLVQGLSRHPGIGLLMVRAERDGPIVIGGHGVRYLADDRVVGHDPAVPYGKHAVESLVRLDAMDHCGDLVAISMIDPETDEVAAFEELIGSHGGLGGWQTKGLIIHPADWQVDGPLVGAPAVYRQIRTWLEGIGIRFGPQPEPESAADAA